MGRVEIRGISGVAGSVCSDGWDSKDARVVCRELGMEGSAVIATTNVEFGFNNYGPVVYSKVILFN